MSPEPTPAEMPAGLAVVSCRNEALRYWLVSRHRREVGQVFRTPDGARWEGCRQLGPATWQMVGPYPTWPEVVARLVELAA